MKKIVDLKDLMVEQLRNLYNGEKQFDKALPMLSAHVTEPRLKRIIDNYLFDHKGQLMRLRQVFAHLYVQSKGETCEAMKSMIAEAHDIIIRCAHEEVMDAGLITALQHIIHYEMAGYGAVCTYAKMLSLTEIAAILHQNLEEEKRADRQLAILAEEVVNEKAERV
jgi:ferritin-like metal-binding protein YciE